jgi:hypothetical protein
MAKHQTRRTVSLGRQHYDRLIEYTRRHGVPASQMTEFALDTLTASDLDVEAFRTWAGKRAVQTVEQTLATNAAMTTQPVTTSAASMTAERKAIGEFVSDRMRVLREEPDANESHVPEITQAERDEWRDIIQRRMRGRVRQPRSVPVGPAPEDQS